MNAEECRFLPFDTDRKVALRICFFFFVACVVIVISGFTGAGHPDVIPIFGGLGIISLALFVWFLFKKNKEKE